MSERAAELIAFRVAGQEFCVDIMSVREIRGFSPPTPLPHAPPFVLGVINLRGSVLPILDLSERLGLGATQATARHVIVVARVGSQLMGLLVESVSDILAAGMDALQPTPEVGCATVRALVQAIVTIEDRMVGLIALDQLAPTNDRVPPGDRAAAA